MKIAIIISGNLRTFFMPTREDPNVRLCDLFFDKIVKVNDADIFAYTDTNDFYHNNVQYFSTDRKIEIVNDNSFRLHDNVDFIDNENAIKIIKENFSIFGDYLKYLYIENLFDPETDPNYNILYNANVKGYNPKLLIQQLRKVNIVYEELKKTNVKYDVILKWRFDNSIFENLDLKKYNYIDNDIYVPGIHSPIIYDWYAFGKTEFMDICLSAYNYIGNFLPEGKIYLCNKCKYYGSLQENLCHTSNDLYEITLSLEYHLFRIFKMNNIRLCNAGYSSFPYRYKDVNINIPIDDVINKLNINASLISYNSGREINEKIYKKNE